MGTQVLFILKRREDYSQKLHSHRGLSTGLYNSASFVCDMLNDLGINSKLEVAIDNNCIDRLVTAHKPKYVIIEALWVVPSKFNILQQLHPQVTWIVRLHSEMPFMAGEGQSMDWIGEYSRFPSVILGINAPRMLNEVRNFLRVMRRWDNKTLDQRVWYLPNYYPQNYVNRQFNPVDGEINIGCFGAIRPLKNQLLQAHAAVEFAEQQGRRLNFHINAGRVEMNGQPVGNNLKAYFAHIYDRGHRLINHSWVPREGFLEICASMDLGMQVSFSETFNIVGADLISQGVPLVGSSEIPWQRQGRADPVDSCSMVKALTRAWRWPKLNVWANQRSLTKYTNNTRTIWKDYFL